MSRRGDIKDSPRIFVAIGLDRDTFATQDLTRLFDQSEMFIGIDSPHDSHHDTSGAEEAWHAPLQPVPGEDLTRIVDVALSQRNRYE